MASAPSRRRLLRLHLGLVLAIALCVSAFVVEVIRALDGNTLSWAYVFEWPILLAYGIYMWQRLVREERTGGPTAARRGPPDADARAEEDRRRWNAYLADVHADDAGGPSPPDAPRQDGRDASR